MGLSVCQQQVFQRFGGMGAFIIAVGVMLRCRLEFCCGCQLGGMRAFIMSVGVMQMLWLRNSSRNLLASQLVTVKDKGADMVIGMP